MSSHNPDALNDSPDSEDEAGGLFSINRRNTMKAAGASAGAMVGGSTLLGSATAETAGGNCVQVDFVTGASEISDLGSSTYTDAGRLVNAQWGETVDNDTEGETVGPNPKSDTCDVGVSSQVSIDFPTETASVDYTVSNCGGDQDLLLVSYESPCNGAAGSGGQWDPATADQQTVFDTATTSTQSDGTLAVDVPPLRAGVPQRDNAVIYRPFDTTDGINCIEGSGSAVGENNNGGSIDKSASGVNASTNNAFDLTPQYGLYSDQGYPINGSSATIACWFNFETPLTDFCRILQVGGSNSNSPSDGYDVEMNGSDNPKIVPWSNGGIGATATVSGTSSGNWYFVVVVAGDASSEIRMHVFDTSSELSGSPVSVSDAGRGQTGDKFLQIGAGDGNYFNGRIEEIYGFDTALTSNEVDSLYNASF
jgi:hypothetical protein